MAEIAARLEGDGAEALLIVNPDAAARPIRLVSDAPIPGGQQAEDGYVLASAEEAPPLAATIARPRPISSVKTTKRTLENQLVRLELADDGTIASLLDLRSDREALDGPGNQIWAYHDQPRVYDAWDIEGDYRRSGEVVKASSIEVVEAGGQRGALKVVRQFGDSTIVQSVRLWANSARIDFATRVDWHDRRVLLKARFPLAVRADHATFECAFGVHTRPTHRNTSWDAAKFEVAAHRFADLSEPGFGVALLNDGRYGHDVLGHELSLSLLRAPIAPDRLADEGEQSFTYALLPHAGAWFEADVLAEAEDLNRPLYHHPAKGPHVTMPLVTVTGPRLGLGALKPAEDGDGLILRVYEPAGARGLVQVAAPPGWSIAGEVSLLEDETRPPSPLIRPFEIRSWRLRRSDEPLRRATEAAAAALPRRAARRRMIEARGRALAEVD
jgi:alpha-mannosidase